MLKGSRSGFLSVSLIKRELWILRHPTLPCPLLCWPWISLTVFLHIQLMYKEFQFYGLRYVKNLFHIYPKKHTLNMMKYKYIILCVTQIIIVLELLYFRKWSCSCQSQKKYRFLKPYVLYSSVSWPHISKCIRSSGRLIKTRYFCHCPS